MKMHSMSLLYMSGLTNILCHRRALSSECESPSSFTQTSRQMSDASAVWLLLSKLSGGVPLEPLPSAAASTAPHRWTRTTSAPVATLGRRKRRARGARDEFKAICLGEENQQVTGLIIMTNSSAGKFLTQRAKCTASLVTPSSAVKLFLLSQYEPVLFFGQR